MLHSPGTMPPSPAALVSKVAHHSSTKVRVPKVLQHIYSLLQPHTALRCAGFNHLSVRMCCPGPAGVHGRTANGAGQHPTKHPALEFWLAIYRGSSFIHL